MEAYSIGLQFLQNSDTTRVCVCEIILQFTVTSNKKLFWKDQFTAVCVCTCMCTCKLEVPVTGGGWNPVLFREFLYQGMFASFLFLRIQVPSLGSEMQLNKNQ